MVTAWYAHRASTRWLRARRCSRLPTATSRSARLRASRCSPGACPLRSRPGTTPASSRRQCPRWPITCAPPAIARCWWGRCTSSGPTPCMGSTSGLPLTSIRPTMRGPPTGRAARTTSRPGSACAASSRPAPARAACRSTTTKRWPTSRCSGCGISRARRARRPFSWWPRSPTRTRRSPSASAGGTCTGTKTSTCPRYPRSPTRRWTDTAAGSTTRTDATCTA
jgi:hypothetical protein